MNFTDRLYVEIVPLETRHAPVPHPIRHGKFDPSYVYKVLGIYNPSETSECYLMLANPQREIWFVPQRHTRAFKLIDSDEFFLEKTEVGGTRACTCCPWQNRRRCKAQDVLTGRITCTAASGGGVCGVGATAKIAE